MRGTKKRLRFSTKLKVELWLLRQLRVALLFVGMENVRQVNVFVSVTWNQRKGSGRVRNATSAAQGGQERIVKLSALVARATRATSTAPALRVFLATAPASAPGTGVAQSVLNARQISLVPTATKNVQEQGRMVPCAMVVDDAPATPVEVENVFATQGGAPPAGALNVTTLTTATNVSESASGTSSPRASRAAVMASASTERQETVLAFVTSGVDMAAQTVRSDALTCVVPMGTATKERGTQLTALAWRTGRNLIAQLVSLARLATLASIPAQSIQIQAKFVV
jgi:hypothetical protein